MPSRELNTRRLVLRPFRPEDVYAFAVFARDPQYRRYLGPTHPEPTAFVENNLKVDWQRELSWVICQDGVPIGSVFLGVDRQDKIAELACLLSPHVWRRRIASEAGLAVVAYAFESLGIEKVLARAAADNVASCRAMERAGMVREGVLRSHRIDNDGNRIDEVLYGLTVDDWHRLRDARNSTEHGHSN